MGLTLKLKLLYIKIVLVTISAQLYRDNISYIITDIAEHYEMTTEDIDSFLIKTPIPANVMYDEILRILDSYTKEHIFWETLNVLVKEFMKRTKRSFFAGVPQNQFIIV